MSPKQTDHPPGQLRQDAEAKLEQKSLSLVQANAEEALLHELIHELSVYKIELEMQNEALRQSQEELEASRDRYVDFYDSAPFAYITLNHDAAIAEINLTGATLLGLERSKLIKRKFSTFVAPADRDQWQQYFVTVMQNVNTLRGELSLQNSEGLKFRAQINCQRLQKDGQETVVRIALTDISDRNTA